MVKFKTIISSNKFIKNFGKEQINILINAIVYSNL